MISLEQGRERLLEKLSPLATETIPVSQATGRFLAHDLPAPSDLPPFDNSAMDGFAVRSSDATPGQRLRVVGRAVAGCGYEGAVEPGTCVRLFTGSPLPAGADAVVMQEDTRQSGAGEIEILEGVGPWENVRFRGEDLRRGSLALAAGAQLTPQAVGLVSALGMHRIDVHRSPVVAVISNGSELISPGVPLPPAGVYESNGLMLKALLERTGCGVVLVPPPADELPAVVSALKQGLASADLVISVGGASVGELDLVRPAFEALGGALDFWQLAMKPGKQFFFGLSQGKPLLGLPGNPVSAFVAGVLLVLPAVRRLAGARTAVPISGPAPLGEPIQNQDRRRHFVRVRTDAAGRIFPSGSQASHFIHGLAQADGLVDMPPGAAWEAGRVVPVMRW